MQVGDLVVSDGARGRMEGVGIVMEPPRPLRSGELVAADETYRIVKVLWPAGIDECFEEDVEVVNESR